MNRFVSMMLGSLLVLGGLMMLLRQPGPPAPQAGKGGEPGKSNTGSASTAPEAGSSQGILLYCAASNRAVMEAIRKDYQQEFGIPVEVQYGASQTLLTSAEVSRTGDLYLPADDSYFTIAQEKNLTAEILPLARMTAVIGVSKGNGKQIKSFQDLLRDDVRLVQANPDAAAIGKLTRQELKKEGLWDQLDAHTTAYRTTVQEVANDLKVGSADAGIVYDAVLSAYPDLESVSLPEFDKLTADIAVGVLTFSKQPARALHFARYLSARDKGLVRYQEHGFKPVEGDAWADVPELTLYAGSMLRPAVEATVKEFEQHEGVKITTVYNGCGILVGQMKAGQVPDAYFACDSEFMKQVQDLFPDPVSVAQNELVILVKKGNPSGIASLKDLTKAGLRVGIGHEKQCAMGWLTQKTLSEGGVQSEVMANVAVQTPSGDMLVNQMQAGSLDAAVVYLSNAVGAGSDFDAVKITGLPCSIATQPLAVAERSKHHQLAERLASRLRSLESRQRFEGAGFKWQDQSVHQN